EYAKRFGRWITRDWKSLGLATAPEVFPKQDEIQRIGSGSGESGSWVRLFGRHHKRDHWSRVYDDGEWLEGDEAIAAILDVMGDPARLTPPAAIEAPPGLPRAAGLTGDRSPRQIARDIKLAKEAIDSLVEGVRDDCGHEFYSEY